MVPHRPTPGNPALPQSVAVEAGAAHATAAPEVAAALRDLLQHDVATWAGRDLERIKLRTVRRVFRGRLGEVPVHVKVFRADTIAARARDALRAGKGEREARHLLQARALGLPAVEPLAFGIALDDGQPCSFVVTRSVAARAFSLPATDSAARAVGALLRRVHDLGLEAGDLHPGNVLLDAEDRPWLCDLTSLRRGGEQDLKRRAVALGFFCNPLDGGALDPVARAVREGYEDAGAPLPDSWRTQLALAAHRWRAAALRSFGRRSERACRHTAVEPRRRGQPRWFWQLGELQSGDGVLDPAVESACRTFAGNEPDPTRSGRRGAVWLTDELAVKDRQAGKARDLWRAHYWLQFAGVPAPQPLALCLHGGRGRVFCRRIDAPHLAAELADGRLDRTAELAIARALGDAVGRLHGHGLRNRDLKFENLMRDPTSGAVCIVDLDGLSLHGADDTRGAGRDLGRLLAAFRHAGQPGGPAAGRAFLRAYARARRRLLQAPPLRRLLRRAGERAGEWARRHATSVTTGA
ncbi:MAG: lipopolysaccharide kinase InaA family protein [Planctomycetota bacterium]